MSTRKRTWTNGKGEEKTAWVVDYVDTKGKRRLKTFKLKKQADAFAATASVEVREGTHVADSDSATVKEAGDLWIKRSEQNGLERGTIVQYRQHLDLHINPLIGSTLLSRLTVPAVRTFEDNMIDGGRSASMVRKVLVSLGSLLSDAQERGLVVRNAVREKSRSKQKGKDRRLERRQKGKLKLGVDIPTREEVKAIVGQLEGKWRPLLLTAIFTGLRASEIRGLRWSDVNLDKRELRVHQRADRFNQIGRPKSEAGERTVPIPPLVANTLKAWRLSCPRPRTGEKDSKGKHLIEEIRSGQLVFPNTLGKVESLSKIMQKGFQPVQIAAGIAVDTGENDKDGKPVLRAKYTGFHAIRHFYASWCINRKEDGGLALPPKMVQERLGHSSITLTMDTYGHLFPRNDDAEELAAAEQALLQ
ncbi:Site-specific recombinase XerD [Phyllobacterium sp. YR620]|uniref:tyrosine-type recombinase/integrase n=1 Tax=Phyllobacterium sp. YR620 TaxID=1881066 RepID=UPI0008896714|nr:site-specific integrase [Phyllobacterium sp. YR620]SDP45912.1 Site-specific recombinase XerD [Phyllobacterium sp. YR620]